MFLALNRIQLKKCPIPLLITLGLSGCDLMDFLGFPPATHTVVTPGVYNLQDINTVYDEYNPMAKALPVTKEMQILFSTNSGTMGKQFDIWKASITFVQDPKKVKDPINPPPKISSQRIGPFLQPETGSESDEFGPVLLNSQNTAENSTATSEKTTQDDLALVTNQNTYLLASNRKGNLDIYFYNPTSGKMETFFGNDDQANDAYPTYHYKSDTLYFTSDRDGKYHIYQFNNKSKNRDFKSWLGDGSLKSQMTRADEFNSLGNDKCPYIFEDIMVFVSDRPGGQGGYDIYISQYVNSQWTSPENLQAFLNQTGNTTAAFNSAGDEYRPSVSRGFSNHLSISPWAFLFSSNRSGGQGGFDLYLGIVPDLKLAK